MSRSSFPFCKGEGRDYEGEEEGKGKDEEGEKTRHSQKEAARIRWSRLDKLNVNPTIDWERANFAKLLADSAILTGRSHTRASTSSVWLSTWATLAWIDLGYVPLSYPDVLHCKPKTRPLNAGIGWSLPWPASF